MKNGSTYTPEEKVATLSRHLLCRSRSCAMNWVCSRRFSTARLTLPELATENRELT
jgi:hypothetical protein